MRFVRQDPTGTWGRGTTLRTSPRVGFTLIEVLLVLAVVGIMCIVTLPHFLGAMREHRLRGAARQLISAGRHAASLAVISQRELDMTFNVEAGVVTVGLAREPAPAGEEGRESDSAPGDEAWSPDVAAFGTAGSPAEDERPEVALPPLLEEDLEIKLDGVRIQSLEIEGEEEAPGSRRAARYFTNGRCTPYRLTLVDEDGFQSTIEVDALCTPEVVE